MSFTADEVLENLTSHRVQIVQELRVDRALLFDYLRSKEVFDSEDCEIIQAEKTSERKASKLLDILESKSTEGLQHFLDVLQLLNPGLYEKLTGHKATARENPIINGVSRKSFSDLDPERDVDILSNHLKSTVADLQEMTLRYDQLLKVNQQLNKSLSNMSSDLDLNSKHLQCLEREALRADKKAREACSHAETVNETANHRLNECEKNMNERQAYVFALLMKLLSTEEEAKELRKQVEEERKKKEELIHKLKEVSQNFDREQRQSLKMSQTLVRQQNSVKKAEDLTNRYRELQFNSEKLQMEKDQAISELNELKTWAEALKARYDVVAKGNQQCQENYENIVVDCSELRKQIQELQSQLSLSQRQEEYLKTQNAELIHLMKKYQVQRDFYGEEREKAINEREEARKERDEITQRFSDVLNEKDEAVRRFLQQSREFEHQHELDTAEMQDLREQLIQTEEELKFLKMKLPLRVKQSSLVSDHG